MIARFMSFCKPGVTALNLETSWIVETCLMTFDESIPCANGGFELAGDDELGQRIFEEDTFVDAGVEAEDDGVDHQPVAEPPVTASSTLVEGPTTTSTTSGLHQVFWDEDIDDDQVALAAVEGEATSERRAPRHIQRHHPPQQMIGNLHEHTTRHSSQQISHFAHSAFVASFEPRDVGHALSDPNWVNAMHEELENFERNRVWVLVEPPPNCHPIGTKWVFKNKQGKNGLVV